MHPWRSFLQPPRNPCNHCPPFPRCQRPLHLGLRALPLILDLLRVSLNKCHRHHCRSCLDPPAHQGLPSSLRCPIPCPNLCHRRQILARPSLLSLQLATGKERVPSIINLTPTVLTRSLVCPTRMDGLSILYQ